MYLCTKESIMHHPEIAIVDPNTLTCLGLKNILEISFQWLLSVYSIRLVS